MRNIRFISALLLFCFKGLAQEIITPDNSYQDYLSKNFPGLKYHYDEVLQTHYYSGNWDFDNDGINDTLFFKGNGAVHTYFHLTIILSSDHQLRTYTFIETDSPMLSALDIKQWSMNGLGFAVVTNNHHRVALLLALDTQTFDAHHEVLKQLQLNKPQLMLYFENGISKFTTY